MKKGRKYIINTDKLRLTLCDKVFFFNEYDNYRLQLAMRRQYLIYSCYHITISFRSPLRTSYMQFDILCYNTVKAGERSLRGLDDQQNTHHIYLKILDLPHVQQSNILHYLLLMNQNLNISVYLYTELSSQGY